ncbi:MAG: hypothetical protein ACWA5R_07475, partial [bacterium]
QFQLSQALSFSVNGTAVKIRLPKKLIYIKRGISSKPSSATGNRKGCVLKSKNGINHDLSIPP